MTTRDDRLRYWNSHPGKRTEVRRENYRQTQGGPNTGKPWTTAEMERIMAEDRPSDRQLAAELGRSVEAIQLKRYRANGGEH